MPIIQLIELETILLFIINYVIQHTFKFLFWDIVNKDTISQEALYDKNRSIVLFSEFVSGLFLQCYLTLSTRLVLIIQNFHGYPLA